jgi:hypothetical protein
MAMKKIKPQYGKVVPPIVAAAARESESDVSSASESNAQQELTEKKNNKNPETGGSPSETAAAEKKTSSAKKEKPPETKGKSISKITSEPNPFTQTKEIFGKARLTKVGYRVRTDYVEILDIIKKIKKGGYTLEAVLDDALTFYFENSEDGKEALRKAEIFYS